MERHIFSQNTPEWGQVLLFCSLQWRETSSFSYLGIGSPNSRAWPDHQDCHCYYYPNLRLIPKYTNFSFVPPSAVSRLPTNLIHAKKGKGALENLCLPFGYKYIFESSPLQSLTLHFLAKLKDVGDFRAELYNAYERDGFGTGLFNSWKRWFQHRALWVPQRIQRTPRGAFILVPTG